jgi:selenocysteine lyase/cysteine desulfurase
MGLHATPDGSGYFLYHSIGLYPGKAERMSEALARVAALWGTPDDQQWARSLGIRGDFIEAWRALLDAPPGTLTTAENVTTALYSVIGALPDKHLAGRKLLIAADCFPSLHFLLAGMAARRGFELVTVPLRPGEHWVRDEDFLEHWTPDVGVALVTWVTSTSSHRCNLPRLIAHGRAMNSLVGVDITQGVGIIPFRLSEYPADFVVSTSLKWLCGIAGAGILHVRESLLLECQPELRGWFSQENAFSWGLDSFSYARDARRFDHGTPSILAFAACLPALQWHARQDAIALLAHNRRLVEVLMEAAPALGLELASPRRADERGGSVMFRLPADFDSPRLVDRLRGAGIFADTRGRVLRLSPGNVTTLEGVELLLRTLRDALRGSR